MAHRFEEVIAESRHFVAGQDWETPIPGFVIVIPRRGDMKSIGDLLDDEARELAVFMRDIRKAMTEELKIETVYLFQREDADHLHFWMFPRYGWMAKFATGIESVRPILKYVRDEKVAPEDDKPVRYAAARLRKALQDKYPVEAESRPSPGIPAVVGCLAGCGLVLLGLALLGKLDKGRLDVLRHHPFQG